MFRKNISQTRRARRSPGRRANSIFTPRWLLLHARHTPSVKKDFRNYALVRNAFVCARVDISCHR